MTTLAASEARPDPVWYTLYGHNQRRFRKTKIAVKRLSLLRCHFLGASPVEAKSGVYQWAVGLHDAFCVVHARAAGDTRLMSATRLGMAP